MKCVPDIVYHPAHQLKLDFYVPDGLVSKACLIYVHAGAFLGGSHRNGSVLRAADAFTQEGFAVAAIELRHDITLGDFSEEDADAIIAAKARSIKVGLTLDPNLFAEGYHAGIEDVSSAIEFLFVEAGELAVGSNRIGVLGAEAGGIVALGTGFSPRHMAERVSPPAAIATLGAALVQPWRMQADAPPCLLINRVGDTTVPLDSAKIGQSRAEALKADFEMITSDVGGSSDRSDRLLFDASGEQTENFHKLLTHFDCLATR